MKQTRSPTWIACRPRSSAAATSSPPRKAAKNSSPSASKKSAESGRRSKAKANRSKTGQEIKGPRIGSFQTVYFHRESDRYHRLHDWYGTGVSGRSPVRSHRLDGQQQ